jgi:hypothetical protein
MMGAVGMLVGHAGERNDAPLPVKPGLV